jgi:hypothetical protein
MTSFVIYRTSIGTLNFGWFGAETHLFWSGTQPALADGKLLLGRLNTATLWGGGIRLHRELAMMMAPQKRLSAALEDSRAGILRVIDVVGEFIGDLALVDESFSDLFPTTRYGSLFG